MLLQSMNEIWNSWRWLISGKVWKKFQVRVMLYLLQISQKFCPRLLWLFRVMASVASSGCVLCLQIHGKWWCVIYLVWWIRSHVSLWPKSRKNCIFMIFSFEVLGLFFNLSLRKFLIIEYSKLVLPILCLEMLGAYQKPWH